MIQGFFEHRIVKKYFMLLAKPITYANKKAVLVIFLELSYLLYYA